MKSPVLIIQGIGKCYSSFNSGLGRFASWCGYPAKRINHYWAVQDLSFTLHSGEAIAIIGTNGAGKSTLLKIITGTIRPTVGFVKINGSISAILELGLGFNPDFTARQNIFLAGGLMGLSTSDLTKLIPSIQDFAELGEFFDQPLRVFSSGMNARLAFALATAVRPDVLIVDEVLSVGDTYFQHKSFARIQEFRELGTTILLVTHTMQDVRALCDRVILLEKGRILKDGPPDEVVDFYNAIITEKENAKLTIEQRRNKDGWLTTKSGTGEATVTSMTLLDSVTNSEIKLAQVNQLLTLKTIINIRLPIPRLVLGFKLRDRQGNVIWGSNTWHTKQVLRDLDGGTNLAFLLQFTCSLGPGSYSFSPALVSNDSHLSDNYEWIDNALVFDVVNADLPFFLGSNCLNARFESEKIN